MTSNATGSGNNDDIEYPTELGEGGEEENDAEQQGGAEGQEDAQEGQQQQEDAPEEHPAQDDAGQAEYGYDDAWAYVRQQHQSVTPSLKDCRVYALFNAEKGDSKEFSDGSDDEDLPAEDYPQKMRTLTSGAYVSQLSSSSPYLEREAHLTPEIPEEYTRGRTRRPKEPSIDDLGLPKLRPLMLNLKEAYSKTRPPKPCRRKRSPRCPCCQELMTETENDTEEKPNQRFCHYAMAAPRGHAKAKLKQSYSKATAKLQQS